MGPSERAFIQDIFKMMDDGTLVDRSRQPLRPTVTLVASSRLKTRDDDVISFLKQLRQRYPFARLVVGDGSPVEKAATTFAALSGMPFTLIKKGEKNDWDEGSEVRDSRCCAAASHVVLFDSSARSQAYRKYAERSLKHVSTV